MHKERLEKRMAKSKAEKEAWVKVAYKIPVALKQKLSEIALAERRSINGQVTFLLESAVEKYSKQPEVSS